ncbi:FABL065Wp [Eremothecium gossypii FDAG1]|nr:FABL065Wp [Eremothecium gossypii FDAG1]
MAPPVLRPENALKRADELISVGEPQAALQSLLDYITSRRIRFADPAAIEPIVFKFLELGVELKRGKVIKDGLYQYRKHVQSSTEGLKSVGAVSRRFIDLIEKKMSSEQAKANAEESTEEDLEGGVTPENLLISVYEQDQSVGGFNDEAVTSWLRFTWESYRTVLDLLRNNSQLEITYSGVVNRAMQFCLKYNRKNEFKRLADMLRQHLDAANYQQQKSKQYTVDLSDPDTLQRYLDQRILQVNVSVKLGLWHEAFRSIEDVHHLLSMSTRDPKPSVLANYYQNMAKVFFVSSNYLLNSVALQKFYDLYQQNPKATDEDFKFYASQLVLSALSIQQDDLPVVGYDPLARLAGFLNLESKPTRSQVIEAVSDSKIFSRADEPVKKLYELLNSDFDVNTLKESLASLLPELNSKSYFTQYVEPLKSFTIRKAFISASKQFGSIKLDELFEHTSLPSPFDLSPLDLEKSLLQAAMNDYVSFSIDHDAGVVSFMEDPFELLGGSTATNADDEQRNDDGYEETHVEEEPEPILTRNSAVRTQLIELAKALKETEGFPHASYVDKVRMARNELIRQNNAIIASEKEAAEERARQLEYEKQSASGVPLTAEQVVEERQRRMKEEKEAAEARMEAEARRRAEEKRERELAAINEKTMLKMIEDINAKGLIFIDPKEAKNMTLEKFKKLTVELVSKDKKDLDERMSHAFKRVDHIERAYRKLEAPLWEKDAQKQKERDLESYNKLKQMMVEKAKKDHEENLRIHERLVKIYPSYLHFREKVIAAQKSQIEALRAENAAKLEAAKNARLQEVRQQRYNELIARRKEELAAKEHDDRQRMLQDRLTKERKERERVNKEKDEAARKQREIEEAVERTIKRNVSATPAPPVRSAPPARAAPPPRASNEQVASPAPQPEKKLTYAEKMKLRRAGRA